MKRMSSVVFLINIISLAIFLCPASQVRADLDILTLAQTNEPGEFFTVALGSNHAFWSHYSKGIYMWKMSNPVHAGTKISDDEEVVVLSASGSRLAWIDDSDDIQVWDGVSTSEWEDDVVDTISLYEENLAFVEEDHEDFWNEDTEIFLRTPGKKTQISDNDYYDIEPSVYGNQVAWVGEHDDNYDLFFWDGQNEYKLTDTDGDDRRPSLYNGAIAWDEWDGDDYEIFYWAGGANIQVTDDDDYDVAPVLRDGRIVWIKKAGSCYDLYSWNGSQIERLTNECYDKITSLDFNGNAILWSAEEDSEKTVNYAVLSATSCRAQTGWWYNPQEPGTGLATEVKNNRISLAWFAFDELGRTTWYTAGGEMTSQDSFTGNLYSWTGWSWGDNYVPPTSNIIGTIVLNFAGSPAGSVTFSVNMNNIVVTKTFTSFMADFSPGSEDSRNITGWWYDPSYDGMGFFMDARGGKMALAWYNYRDDRSARWWTSYNIFSDGAPVYIGNLDGWTGGPCATCPYNGPPSMIPAEGGSITITFSDAEHAVAQAGDNTINLERFQLP